MSITINGNSLVFDGTVTVTNATNPTTGVCTLILTPSGGVGNLPALATGNPGQPALFDSPITVNTLASGSLATASLTQVSPGGPGTSSHYTLTLGIPQGAPGAPGSSGTLGGASDLSGTAALNNVPVVTGTGPTAFQYKSIFGNVYNATSFTSVNSSGQTTVQLCSVAVPPQSFNWFPICLGTCNTTGTANTVINLTANLNTPTGTLVGAVYGVSGVAKQSLTMASGFGGLTNSGVGKVTAGSGATVYFNAVQTANVADAWSTSNTTTSFTVIAFPVVS